MFIYKELNTQYIIMLLNIMYQIFIAEVIKHFMQLF